MRIRNWDVFFFVAGYHVLMLALVPFVYMDISWGSVGWLLLNFIIGGLSITAGYHRLYAHKSYAASPVFEWMVLLGSTLAWQWSALAWSHDHRLHHKHVDTEQDPYSIKKGFWYAHFLWLFDYRREYQPALVADLLKNPRVVLQDKHYLLLAIVMNLLVFGIGCLFFDPLVSFFMGVLLRILAIHHCTWFINSLAHVWGSRTYARELSAVDNAILAVLTFGEGYHNYHHIFASDYRNGIRWYHFDPTKWLIWVASRLRMTRGLRTVSHLRLQQILIQQDKKLFLTRLNDEIDELASELKRRLHDVSTRFEQNAARFVALIQDIKRSSHHQKTLLSIEARHLKRELRANWKSWLSLTSLANRHYTLAH